MQYANQGLGIDVANSSYSEICAALADYFPEGDLTIFDNGYYDEDLTGGWLQSRVTVGTTLSSSGSNSAKQTVQGYVTTNNGIRVPSEATYIRFKLTTGYSGARYGSMCFGLATLSERTSNTQYTVGAQYGQSAAPTYNNQTVSFNVTSVRGQLLYPKFFMSTYDPSYAGSYSFSIQKIWFSKE